MSPVPSDHRHESDGPATAPRSAAAGGSSGPPRAGLVAGGNTLFGADDRIPAIPAWQAFSELDVLLALLALPAIGVPISAALSKGPAVPVAFTVVATTASFLAVLLVVFGIRLAKTKKFMPSGLMLVVTLAALVLRHV